MLPIATLRDIEVVTVENYLTMKLEFERFRGSVARHGGIFCLFRCRVVLKKNDSCGYMCPPFEVGRIKDQIVVFFPLPSEESGMYW